MGDINVEVEINQSILILTTATKIDIKDWKHDIKCSMISQIYIYTVYIIYFQL